MNNDRDALFYMANLGSEFMRILKSYRAENDADTENAVRRAVRILDTLEGLPDMVSRREELKLLRLLLEDVRTRSLQIEPGHLESYFLPFALRAANRP